MSMISPSIEELTRGRFNRYSLVIATAKCARLVTNEYVKQREYAETLIANKATDRSLVSMIRREFRDEKAVKSAITRLAAGEFEVVTDGEGDISVENLTGNPDHSEAVNPDIPDVRVAE
ncbi:MAG: hypothetical protein LUI15_01615 [Firmicutes bacterium]|nr:hypothetical protein [Bacillota bacterium]MCD7782588.1 hypothetical protein [Bacillota bacterium]MCD7788414.1 hypothetical protein [Bacillota bacterium]MCD7944926.1 hypothetical protein [Clostridia bacterium]